MQIVAGIEIHIQLQTKTKAFSASPIGFGGSPNERASAIDIGMPGTLPVVNKEMLSQAIMLGTWLNSKINALNTFARKHYFYPDLPKGYQITQDENPILTGGYLEYEVKGETKRCELHHAHLEEDAGKSVHGYKHGISGVDLNRAGQPLLEIVTEPCLNNIDEIIAFLKRMHSIVTYLGICDGNMQEGSFRCDVNVSIRKDEHAPLGTRVELKNMNSFKFIQKALEFEISRQTDLLEDGKKIVQETRQYNEKTGKTESMRDKETAQDYRYFKDPDIPAVWIDDAFIAEAVARLPESPTDRLEQYVSLGVPKTEATIIAYNKPMGDYLAYLIQQDLDPKLASNWLLGPVSEHANKEGLLFNALPISAKELAELLTALRDDIVSSKMAKEVFGFMWTEQKSAATIIEEKGLKQLTNEDEIAGIIMDIIQNNPSQVDAYRNGKDKLFGFFVGQAMKATKGQANPVMSFFGV